MDQWRNKKERMRDLWGKEQFMRALSEAWCLNRALHTLFALETEGLNLHGLVFSACQQAVLSARTKEFKVVKAEEWADTLLQNAPPPALTERQDDGKQAEAFKDYRRQMIQTYLRCAQLAMQPGPFAPESMESIQEDIQKTAQQCGMPAGFIRDIVWSLIPECSSYLEPTSQTQRVSVIGLLVAEKLRTGFPAVLTLELRSNGHGALYPHPALTFICRDAEFQCSETNACARVEELWQARHAGQDIRWQLNRHDGQPITSISGPSLGLTFTMGMAKLLVME